MGVHIRPPHGPGDRPSPDEDPTPKGPHNGPVPSADLKRRFPRRRRFRDENEAERESLQRLLNEIEAHRPSVGLSARPSRGLDPAPQPSPTAPGPAATGPGTLPPRASDKAEPTRATSVARARRTPDPRRSAAPTVTEPVTTVPTAGEPTTQPTTTVPTTGVATRATPVTVDPAVLEHLRRTPSDRVPVPVPRAGEEPDLDAPEFYLNRELTWLNFNFRVLSEAEDERNPLLERLKFISIVGSNLDEFFMKRIGGLKQQVGAGFQGPTVDGRTPEEQIHEAYGLIRQLTNRKRAALSRTLHDLRDKGIVAARHSDLSKDQRRYLREYYLENIYPLVTPQGYDPAHPFPFISNLSLNLLVTLLYPKEQEPVLARVKVPVGAGIPRFLRIPGSDARVPLESVMAANLDLLFPGMTVEACEFFRVTRNANTEQVDELAEDLLAQIETGLRERRFAPIVRLEVQKGMDPARRGMLAAELGLDEEEDVFEVSGLLAMRDLLELTAIEDPRLHYAPHKPVDRPELTRNRSVFYTLREVESVLVHHPYESFTTSVERFLEEASEDPKVRAIKMTFYRTSEESKAINYLIAAARNGKQVAVVMELKARFDEKANMGWAARLSSAGIHVTYGVMGLKTHCKAILVVRQDYDGIRRYAHIGTGNYHAGTARQYSDLGLLTTDELIGQDLTELFNYLTTGFKPKRRYNKLVVAPKFLKRALLEKIEREVGLHTEESPGLIQMKMNALEDPDITKALYKAGRAGVHVDLIVRDTCRLRPGIPGLSENIRVVSLVGRFLEHSRIYYFRNGGDPECYIGSADCMTRNLESRVEAVTPVERPELREELRFMLDAQLRDMRGAWEMLPDGSYIQLRPSADQELPSSQTMLAERSMARSKEANRLRRRRPHGPASGSRR